MVLKVTRAHDAGFTYNLVHSRSIRPTVLKVSAEVCNVHMKTEQVVTVKLRVHSDAKKNIPVLAYGHGYGYVCANMPVERSIINGKV